MHPYLLFNSPLFYCDKCWNIFYSGLCYQVLRCISSAIKVYYPIVTLFFPYSFTLHPYFQVLMCSVVSGVKILYFLSVVGVYLTCLYAFCSILFCSKTLLDFVTSFSPNLWGRMRSRSHCIFDTAVPSNLPRGIYLFYSIVRLFFSNYAIPLEYTLIFFL